MPKEIASQNAPAPPSGPELAGRERVLEKLAAGAPAGAVLEVLVELLEEQLPQAICSILLIDPVDGTLRRGAAPHLPAEGGELVLSSSTPILCPDGTRVGSLALYYRENHHPFEGELKLIEDATRLAGLAIERRRTEQELEAQKEQFRVLLESASDLIIVLEGDGTIRYHTPSLERVLGYGKGVFLGQPALAWVHPEDVPVLRTSWRHVVCRPTRPDRQQCRFRHSDGSWKRLEFSIRNLLDDATMHGIVVVASDVTERNRAEEQRLASEERYRELFENAHDMVYTHDLTGRITSLNRAGERLTGYSREEAIERSMADLVAPEFRGLIRQMIECQVGGESRRIYALDLLSKTGKRVPVETSVRLIFQNGQPFAVQGVGRDVTERKNLESQLLHSQKMEAVGRLAGGVAHDFNNLLTVITGYTQWMLDEMAPDSPIRENAAEVLLAAGRASALTSQLLAFSRNQVIQPFILNLNERVASMDQMLRRVIGEDIELVTVMQPNLGLVKADLSQIEQVIMNLVVNARDAMPGGGKLTIETDNVRIGEEEARASLDCSPGDYVMLSVADTGSGMDEQTQRQMFEPFFTTKETGKGTGLGLSTVYGVVRQSGGAIRCESEVGVGTVFRIYLPLCEDVSVAGERATPNPARGTETILLVEDEAGVRRLVRQMLLRQGYTILEAADGEAAERYVREYDKPIQLLLTDVVMPEQSGKELADRLTSLRSGLKVLFMSGYTGDLIISRGMTQPGLAFLQKPFTPGALASKVREVLESA